jgi:SulP family sulfate permease
MTGYGMDVAMIAGGILAVSTYAVQTIAYLHPVRGHMTAVTLRSSRKNRGYKAELILDMESIGRTRILVVQLQGHLFFGNIAQLNDSINEMLSKEKNTSQQPWIVILDFSLVLGIDSSAAQAMIKLKQMMRGKHSIQLCIFVSGSEIGFPCEFPLSGELSDRQSNHGNISLDDKHESNLSEDTALLKSTSQKQTIFSGCRVYQSLDLALHFAESALIAKQDITLLDEQDIHPYSDRSICKTYSSESEEREAAVHCMLNICPEEVEFSDVEMLISSFEREVYKKGVYLWKQGSSSDSAKLLLSGRLLALLENEAGTSELVESGAMIGELGLVQGTRRMSSVKCLSDEVILYTISREAFEEITLTNPKVARCIDLICINYLANRVQHVSNRIFETRCLPI